MKPLPKRVAALAVVALAATGLAACGKSSSGGTAPTSSKPVKGGTLHIVAAAGPSQFDPVPAYGTFDYILERAYTRQLVQDRDILYVPDSEAKNLLNRTLESAIQSTIGVTIYSALVYSQRY